MSEKEVVLPMVASDLIEIALADLDKVEALSDIYKVDMGAWHEPRTDDNLCHVCLAGAVMAQTCGLSPDEYSVGVEGASDQIDALNRFRLGRVASGLRYLGIARDFTNRHVAAYSEDPAQFKIDLRDLALDLRELGL